MAIGSMKNIHQTALSLIQQNDWEAAHRLVQDYSDPLSCQIHGYLHRIEGDLANARYWYQRAGMIMPENSIAQEINRLLGKLTEDEG